jgi:hypothetical protein
MDDDTKLLCRYRQLASRRTGIPLCVPDPSSHRLADCRAAPIKLRGPWWKWAALRQSKVIDGLRP